MDTAAPLPECKGRGQRSRRRFGGWSAALRTRRKRRRGPWVTAAAAARLGSCEGEKYAGPPARWRHARDLATRTCLPRHHHLFATENRRRRLSRLATGCCTVRGASRARASRAQRRAGNGRVGAAALCHMSTSAPAAPEAAAPPADKLILCCALCGLETFYDYHGRTPPWDKGVVCAGPPPFARRHAANAGDAAASAEPDRPARTRLRLPRRQVPRGGVLPPRPVRDAAAAALPRRAAAATRFRRDATPARRRTPAALRTAGANCSQCDRPVCAARCARAPPGLHARRSAVVAATHDGPPRRAAHARCSTPSASAFAARGRTAKRFRRRCLKTSSER